MKKTLITLGVTLVLIHSTFGQDSTIFIKKLYIGFGFSPISTIQSPGTLNVSLNSELDKSYVLGLRYYNSYYKDQKNPTPDKNFCFGCPIHIIKELNISLGKSLNINSLCSFSVTTGPSYIKYTRPENIKPATSVSWFLPSGYYTFDEVDYNLFGWSTRVDFNIYPLTFIGLSLGAFYNYNSMQPIGGLNCNLLLGRLRQKNK